MVSDPFLLHHDLIDRAIAMICRRHGLSGPDAEDFASDVRVYLLDRDRAVLRAFEGRSSMATYLVAVVAHRLQDWRNAKWGKWRPSTEARRLGPLAVRIETLVSRDRLSLDEAYETLRTRDGIQETRADVEALARRLPARIGRVQTTDEVLDQRPAPDHRADENLERSTAAGIAARASALLDAAVQDLTPDDRLILKMRFDQEIRVSDMARTMGLDQKALYRRFDRVLASLRHALERAGITAADAAEVLAHRGFDWVGHER